jgi:hypothetical protein
MAAMDAKWKTIWSVKKRRRRCTKKRRRRGQQGKPKRAEKKKTEVAEKDEVCSSGEEQHTCPPARHASDAIRERRGGQAKAAALSIYLHIEAGVSESGELK